MLFEVRWGVYLGRIFMYSMEGEVRVDMGCVWVTVIWVFFRFVFVIRGLWVIERSDNVVNI